MTRFDRSDALPWILKQYRHRFISTLLRPLILIKSSTTHQFSSSAKVLVKAEGLESILGSKAIFIQINLN
jgi:hypothetical protein